MEHINAQEKTYGVRAVKGWDFHINNTVIILSTFGGEKPRH
jgi:hypothetical protein